MSSKTGAVYWMDLTFFTFICCNNCNFYLKRPKINEKEAGDGPCFLKKLSIWTIGVNVHLKIPCTLGDISLGNQQSRNPSKSTHVWLLSFDLFETSSAHLQLLTWPALVPQNETLSTCLTLYFFYWYLSLVLIPFFLPFSLSPFLYCFIFFHQVWTFGSLYISKLCVLGIVFYLPTVVYLHSATFYTCLSTQLTYLSLFSISVYII